MLKICVMVFTTLFALASNERKFKCPSTIELKCATIDKIDYYSIEIKNKLTAYKMIDENFTHNTNPT